MNSYILGDVVQAIKDSVETKIIDINGEEYLTRQVHLPPVGRQAHALKLHTLSGLVDYIKANIDEIGTLESAIHVVDHETVQLIGNLHPFDRTRELFVEVDCSLFTSKFQYGNFQKSEQFIIDLQSQFVSTETRNSILAIIGNIKEEAVKNTSDDGISQEVIARSGIATVSTATVPNPIKLKPF
jgi:DNA helicase IV